jgi:hypothetical protein
LTRPPRWLLPLVALPVAWWSLTHTGVDWGLDVRAYWLPDPIGRYPLDGRLEGIGDFRYAPPLALAVIAFGLLPWGLFLLLWMAMLVGVLAWLVGWRWLPLALAVPFVARSLAFGNIEIPMAASLTVPVLWLLPIMAKVTPAVLLAWFVVRREWGTLARIGAVGIALAVVAEIVLPGSWGRWAEMIRASAGADALYLPLRLVAAVLLTVHAGLTGRRWLLPVALLLSIPHLGWSSLAVLVGVLRLREADPVPPSVRRVAVPDVVREDHAAGRPANDVGLGIET